MGSIKPGLVVKAIAGKENGSLYVALGTDPNGRILIANGSDRRVEAPKAKNPKHLTVTKVELDITQITNKKLRQQLRTVSTQDCCERPK